MTQQVFAQSIGTSPATLSSIFTGRTNPTMNIVGAIKKKIPNISTDWLMFGTGPMYIDAAPQETTPPVQGAAGGEMSTDLILDFDAPSSVVPSAPVSAPRLSNSVRTTRQESPREEVKNPDKPPRRIMEIRVFYDDQTWDSFVPAKK